MEEELKDELLLDATNGEVELPIPEGMKKEELIAEVYRMRKMGIAKDEKEKGLIIKVDYLRQELKESRRQIVEMKYSIEDLQDEYGVNIEALVIMECIRPHVSTTLFDMLMMQLPAFTGEMQVEVADNLLDFVNEGVLKYTGCTSADMVLDACYKWIEEEKGGEL